MEFDVLEGDVEQVVAECYPYRADAVSKQAQILHSLCQSRLIQPGTSLTWSSVFSGPSTR